MFTPPIVLGAKFFPPGFFRRSISADRSHAVSAWVSKGYTANLGKTPPSIHHHSNTVSFMFHSFQNRHFMSSRTPELPPVSRAPAGMEVPTPVPDDPPGTGAPMPPALPERHSLNTSRPYSVRMVAFSSRKVFSSCLQNS
jgi:hypothetical protein